MSSPYDCHPEHGRTAHPDSWYARTAGPAPAFPPLDGSRRTDVAILGAGYTGLSAALHLAERGYKVVVLEAKRVGWGGSGRNGGQLITGYNRSIGSLRRLVGKEDALRLWDLAVEARDLVARMVERHGIPCALTWGHLFAASKSRHMAELEEADRELRSLGHQGAALLDRTEIRMRVGSEKYVGGLLDPRGGHLHPLSYALGLARACRGLGVALHEETPVTAIEAGKAPSLVTSRGRVRAGSLIIAGNALLDGLAPELRRMASPLATHMAVTGRMEETRLRRLLRDDIAVCDMDFVVNYFRRTPDGRMLFGAGIGGAYPDVADLPDRMRRSVLKVFPQLADMEFDHVWSGLVDMTVNRLPHLGRLGPDCYFAQGFSGQGVSLTAVAGRVLAEAVAGQAERFDLFARIPHVPFPLDPLRRPALALAILWYRLRDMI